MQKIKQLSPLQAAKIAAGEVVERPANIVKELIENSIDAKATSIAIYLHDGGREYIKIVDNGYGMSIEDAKMSIKHHATSKINSIDDLSTVTTFGFRGEALSSITSISKTILITKTASNDIGIKLQISSGNITEETAVSCNTGTEIIIDDIFFNVPARKKFLKSKETEWRAILQIFNAFCLDYINIHFKIYSEDKIIHNYPPAISLIDRLKQIYEHSLTNSLYSIENSSDKNNLRITGAITDSHYNRYDRNLIFIFVNNRWIKNYKLSQAIIKGYRSSLPTGKFPAGFIFINCDTNTVDINIHPRKEEVHFLNPKIVEDLLENAVKTSLDKAILSKLGQTKKEISSTRFTDSFSVKEWNDKLSDKFKLNQTGNDNGQSAIIETHSTSPMDSLRVNKAARVYPEQTKHADELRVSDNTAVQNTIVENIELEYQLLGQFNKTYILIETQNGLTLIDQHAAHERVLYESVKNKFLNCESFNLIIPKIVSVGTQGVELLNKYTDVFLESGLNINIIGHEQISIKQIPIFLKDKSLDILIKDIINLIITEKTSNSNFKNIIFERIRAQMSCSGAIKSGDILNNAQMNTIIKNIFISENRLSCPHGRPTLWLLNSYEIEKKFKRDYK